MINIVPKINNNGTFEPDLSMVRGGVLGFTLNPDGETYTVNVIHKSITPAQCREQLWRIGLRQQVQQYIEQDERMLDWWEYALEIRRTNEYVEQMRVQLGWTEEQTNEFFEEASKIE